MNYAEMAAKLKAVRKEIRRNVPELAVMDLVMERHNRDLEAMIWMGSPFSQYWDKCFSAQRQ